MREQPQDETASLGDVTKSCEGLAELVAAEPKLVVSGLLTEAELHAYLKRHIAPHPYYVSFQDSGEKSGLSALYAELCATQRLRQNKLRLQALLREELECMWLKSVECGKQPNILTLATPGLESLLPELMADPMQTTITLQLLEQPITLSYLSITRRIVNVCQRLGLRRVGLLGTRLDVDPQGFLSQMLQAAGIVPVPVRLDDNGRYGDQYLTYNFGTGFASDVADKFWQATADAIRAGIDALLICNAEYNILGGEWRRLLATNHVRAFTASRIHLDMVDTLQETPS